MPSKTTKVKPAKKPMSKAHKAALATGREEGRAVRLYLEALEANKPKRGRKRTPQSIDKQIADIDEQLDGASPLNRLLLTQKRIDLQFELDNFATAADLSELEAGFIESAATYGERKGITYDVWRKGGVTPTVLRQAGIGR